MRVYFIQHGKAVDEKTNPQRPLSEEGVKETEKMASLLASPGLIKIARIYHSVKLRSKQTAEILSNHLKPAVGLQQLEEIKPNDAPEELALVLNNVNEDVMVAGHMPHLSRTVSMLLTGDADAMPAYFSNSGVICLEKSEDKVWGVAPVFVFG